MMLYQLLRKGQHSIKQGELYMKILERLYIDLVKTLCRSSINNIAIS